MTKGGLMRAATTGLLLLSACSRDGALPGGLFDGPGPGPGGSGDGGADDATDGPRGNGPPDYTPCSEPPSVPPLAALRAAMVGSWRGMTSTPWTAPYTTEVTFSADGHYRAHTVGGSGPAFYYGTDDDSPQKTYLLDNLLANGDGSGEIEILFFAGTPTNRGLLEHVRACHNRGGDRLDFEFWAAWVGRAGPVTFRLARQ